MKESNQTMRTRKNITTALIELMRTRDFEDISVKDICERAMVTRATFYKYYEDKYHLVRSFVEDCKTNIIDAHLKNFEYKSPKELYIKIAELCLDFFTKNEEDFCMFINHSFNFRLTNLLIDTVNSYVEEFMRMQGSQEDYQTPISVLSHFLTGGLVQLVIYFVQNKGKYTKEQVLEYIGRMMQLGPFATNI